MGAATDAMELSDLNEDRAADETNTLNRKASATLKKYQRGGRTLLAIVFRDNDFAALAGGARKVRTGSQGKATARAGTKTGTTRSSASR